VIVKKIRRQSPRIASERAEFAYMIRVSRYIVRADARDLHQLARACEDDYLRDLARYAVAEGREQVPLATGALNLFGIDLEEWQAEMAALLHRSPDVVGAIDHWVFSWPEGEQPTVAEAERTISIFLRCQGLANVPAVWGYHGDTENAHLHLQVMRIDRQTGARLTGGDGWDIDTAHRAKAVIEAEFPHWTAELGSRYAVRDGVLVEKASDQVIGKADDTASWKRRRGKSDVITPEPTPESRQIDRQSIAYEEATGFMSRTRVALEVAVPTVLAAPTLDAAHAALAEQGVELRNKGSGATFIIDGKLVKASVDRRTSLAAIEKRFGTELTPCPYKIAPHRPRERWPNDPQRRTYFALRRAHDERLRAAADDARDALGGHVRDQTVATALKGAIAAAAFPAFEAWCAGAGAPDPDGIVMGALGMSAISVEALQPRTTKPIVSGFRGTRLGKRTVYRAPGQGSGPPAFVDVGHKVFVYSSTNRAAVRASLLLIAARYPDNKVAVTGDRKFQNLVLDLAEEEGINLDGALGLRQATERAARARMQTVVRPSPATAIGADAALRNAAVQAASAARAKAQRVSAMVRRLFHSADWAVADHWTAQEVTQTIITDPRTMVRSTTELPGSPGNRDADVARQAAGQAAHRAAVVAAVARSR
jgi:hypothetical protein